MELLGTLAAFVLAWMAWRKGQLALAEVRALRAQVAALAPADRARAEEAPDELPEPAVSEPAAPAFPEAAVPPPLPAPLPEPVAASARPGMDLERLLTQRWGTWLGGVAILLAGVFLIRTAADRGWLGPAVRCLAGLALGLALVGGGFWTRRRSNPEVAGTDYVPAALAAGGLGVLFAAAYGAGPLYGLAPEPLGFGLLAVVALGGLALSLLFGPLVGALGLLAGFATPALVQSQDPSLPGLFGYLLLVSAACWAVVRQTAWTWLGWGAALFGAGWVLLVALPAPLPDAWAPGLFVPASAALTLALLPGAALEHKVGRRFAWAPMLMLGLAGLALASVTDDSLVRAGLLLLAPIAVAKAWVEPRLAWLPSVSAGLGLATLLTWRLAGVQPTGEAITVEGAVRAVLPGDWAPGAIVPFLQVSALVALLHAAAGLVGERRRPTPLPWAALVAGVPVLALAIGYAEVGRFQPNAAWALACGVLAAALVGVAALARREGSLQRAGVHAAGAVGALALGCAIVLEAAWLTVALAAMLPALAWIGAAVGLPALRRVALVIAGVVLARLVLNPWLLDYPVDGPPVLNVLLVAYGLPTACFALAARLFGRGTDRLHGVLQGVLQAGACLFAGLLLVLEVRQWQHGPAMWDADPGFGEVGWFVTLLGGYALALLALASRSPGRVLAVAAGVAGVLALVGGVGLLVFNPLLFGLERGQGVLLNDLLPAYLLPALLAIAALARGARWRRVLGGYALLALLMWATCTVRQAFHPGEVDILMVDSEGAELWALSGAWSVLAAATLAAGIGLRVRALRLAGLALVALVVAKVFLVDMAGLDGLWRVLSFLGLGLGLIGLGAAYRRFGGRL